MCLYYIQNDFIGTRLTLYRWYLLLWSYHNWNESQFGDENRILFNLFSTNKIVSFLLFNLGTELVKKTVYKYVKHIFWKEKVFGNNYVNSIPQVTNLENKN